MIAGKVNWGIVPFRVKVNSVTPDAPGFEPVSHSYLRQMFTGEGAGKGNLVDYFLDVSHGKLDISGSTVLPWLDLPIDSFTLFQQYLSFQSSALDTLTAQGIPPDKASWAAASATNIAIRGLIKQRAYDEIKKQGLDVSPFFGLIFVVEAQRGLPLSDGAFVVIADNSPRDERLYGLDLSGVANEMGHGLGLEDSVQADLGERTDFWDLMSVYGPQIGLGLLHNFPIPESAHFAEGHVHPPASPPLPFTRHGPGLNAVNMNIMGWLDMSRVVRPSGAETVTLRPLHRRDLPGHLAAQVGTYLLEFRMNEKWDAGVPKPCVLLHEVGWQPTTSRARSELVVTHKNPNRSEMVQGDTFELGNSLDIVRPFLRITIEEINPSERRARISVIQHAGRQPNSGVLYGGVDVGGGGLIWTPGGGFKRLPPDSPLHQVFDVLASVQTLSEGPEGESRKNSRKRQQVVNELVEQLKQMIDRAAQSLSP